MELLSLAAAGMVAALCAVVVRQRAPEIAFVLAAAACLLLLWNTLPLLETIRDDVEIVIAICAGDIEKNVVAARAYSRFAVEQGYIPIAPHLLFPQFLNDNDPKERELGLFFGNAIMSKCSEIWVFGSHISPGMEAEIKRAKWKNYRLRYFTENLEEV